jgi:hypothetical protein
VEVFVQALAGVFLQVGAGQVDDLLVGAALAVGHQEVIWPPTTTGSSNWLIW